jgi:predicted dithiol-disulfide oxidoreductase (DUF899 family)
MTAHLIVSHDEWIKASKALLKKEKEFTKLREQMAEERRKLPWEKVEKEYVFQAPEGRVTLADLFAGRGQLIVQHFMFGPDWNEGCPSCSYWSDNFNGIQDHLAARDTSFVVVSRGPVEKLEAYRKRMGWTFRWVSSLGSDFNFDYRVSFAKDETALKYNFDTIKPHGEENPGISAFRRENGVVFRTYSTYGRGLDLLNGAYHLLDITSKGRDEAELPWPMAWVRRHDKYQKEA